MVNSAPGWLTRWLGSFRPAPVTISLKDQLVATAGALIGIFLVGLICHFASVSFAVKAWMIASLGASSVLLFVVPGSPFSQPWAAVGGHLVSVTAGMICYHLFGETALGAAAAAAVAILAMLQLRCLHPPGGGTALLPIMAHTTDWHFIFYPTTINAAALVVFALIFHRFTKHRYPSRQMAPARAKTPALRNFDPADLDAALGEYNQVLSINREDLEDLIQRTELQSFRRLSGAMTCAQIMTPHPKTVHFGTDLKDAWALMEKHDIKALPVVTRQKRITGLLNRADFLREAAVLNPTDPTEGLRRLLERSPTPHSDKPEACGQIMSETWQYLPVTAPAEDLVPLLLSLDHPHVLITDDKKHLVGIVAKSDLMRSLAHAA